MHIKSKYIFYTVVGFIIVLLTFLMNRKIQDKPRDYEAVQQHRDNGIKDGIHTNTGLIDDKGLPLVIAHCTSCHSAKLITQNRLSKEGWQETIKWMQETQNLWDLGDDELSIVSYLAKNYAPVQKGRREPLLDVAWYVLED